ncbi:MAG TPA: homocysteine S-methyltransferase family protein, partial [Opitutus sp.]|nr:homocysteine S-methyltransferase family protein [Opitutus sp.]
MDSSETPVFDLAALAARAAHSTAGLQQLLSSKIAILDGAMGSMVQTYQLKEADFRGERFKSFAHDLQGNNDLLSLTQPGVVEEIHYQYFAAEI